MNPLSSLSPRDTARAPREDDRAPRPSSTFSRNDARHTETRRETQAPRRPSEEDSEPQGPRPDRAQQHRRAPHATQEKEPAHRPEDFAAFLHQAQPAPHDETSAGDAHGASVTVETLSSTGSFVADVADLVSSYSATSLYQGETASDDTNSAQTHAESDESTATKAPEHSATQTSQTKEARADSSPAVTETREVPGSSAEAGPSQHNAPKNAQPAPSEQKPSLSLDTPSAQNPHAAPDAAAEVAPPLVAVREAERVKLDATFNDEADNTAARGPDSADATSPTALSFSSREVQHPRAPEAPQTPAAMARPERPELQEALRGTLQNERAELVIGEGNERIAITIKASAARVRVELVAGTSEAAAAMRNTAHELQTALSQRGLSLGGFSASSQDKESHQSQARDEDESAPRADLASSQKTPAPLARRGLRAIA